MLSYSNLESKGHCPGLHWFIMKKVDVVALDWAKRLRWVLSHVLKGEQAGFPLYPLLRSCKEESEATTSLSLYHTWCAVHQQHAAALDRRGERFPSVMDFPYNGQQRWEKWFFVWTKYVWRRLNIRMEKKSWIAWWYINQNCNTKA